MKSNVWIKSWRNNAMEKRSHERIRTLLDVKVLNYGSLHKGLVTNLSEKGMHCITVTSISSGLNIELIFPLEGDDLKVPVKIIRTIEIGGLYYDFGAELLNSSQDYIEFVHSLKASL
jgi:hypothetical protein